MYIYIRIRCAVFGPVHIFIGTHGPSVSLPIFRLFHDPLLDPTTIGTSEKTMHNTRYTHTQHEVRFLNYAHQGKRKSC